MVQSAPDLRSWQLQEPSLESGPMTDLSHVHRSEGSDRRGLKSIKDHVSTDICDIVEVSKSDLVARGVAIGLLQMAK